MNTGRGLGRGSTFPVPIRLEVANGQDDLRWPIGLQGKGAPTKDIRFIIFLYLAQGQRGRYRVRTAVKAFVRASGLSSVRELFLSKQAYSAGLAVGVFKGFSLPYGSLM